MIKWQDVKLKDVCIQITDGVHSTVKDNSNGDYFLLSCKNLKNGKIVIGKSERKIDLNTLQNLRKRTRTNKGDVLLSSVGTIGEAAIVKENNPKYEFQRSVAIFKPDKKYITSEFLFYSLNNNKILLQHNAEGAVQQCLFINPLKEFIIPLPPLDVQKKIAGVLGALDDKIELNNKINQNLEAQAQALFKSWFIDFEPFGGKMPNDWKIGKLSDIAEYSNDTISTEFTSFENYISTENMLPNRGGISRASSLPTGNTVKSYRTTDVLISNIRPYFKKIWFALFSGGCSNDILVFRSKKDSPAFVFNVLNQDDFFEYVMSGANGSKMPRGDKKHIMQYKVIIPSAKTIKEFENIAITFLEKFSNNNQENVRLAELRDTLLPKLMNGEIDVDNVKID